MGGIGEALECERVDDGGISGRRVLLDCLHLQQSGMPVQLRQIFQRATAMVSTKAVSLAVLG